MKFIKTFTTTLCLLITMTMFAQHEWCGLHDNDILIERLLSNKKYLKEIGIEATKNVVSYVPVKYHIIGREDLSGRVSPKRVLDMHCTLNEFYAEDGEGIQFYIKDGFSYIDNTTAYENHASFAGQVQFTNNRDPNAVNIFIPRDANIPNGPDIGVVLGYYSPQLDWIVIRKADANRSSFTAPHELGHFFSLPHPFNGWESSAFNGSGMAPATSPGGIPTEKMDGSNCETSGDFICDTPPSYLFFSSQTCNYNGGALDPCGVLVDPDELNVMDYFPDNCSPKILSQGQKDLINADFAQRTSLQTNFTPPALSIASAPTIIQPVDDATTSGFDQVIFEWDPVAGADRYLLEIDRLSSFDLDPYIQVVHGTQRDLFGIFEPDRTYHWRVTPFNEYYTCAPSTATNRFTTGLSTNTNNVLEVNALEINPNPVSQDNIMITIDTPDAFDGNISIVSLTGQTLRTISHHFAVGNSALEMNIGNIPNGMYLVNVRSGDKIINKKIIVAK